jgi:hypothetical protein
MRLIFSFIALLYSIVVIGQTKTNSFKIMPIDSGKISSTSKPLPRQSSEKPTIAGKSGGDITKEELLNSHGLEALGGHQISEYKMSIYKQGSWLYEFHIRGNKLAANMKEAINGVKSGTSIYFEYIICNSENGSSHLTKPLSFVVK